VSLPVAPQPRADALLGGPGAARRPRAVSALRWTAPAAFGIAVLGTPLVASGYPLREATTVVMYMALALSWNLIGGLCGYPSIGNVAFFGIEAYVTAGLVATLHWAFFAALGVAAAAALAFAGVIGPIVLRLNGHYFAIATLGTAQALGQIVIMVPAVGGPNGIILRVPFAVPESAYYYLMAGALGLALVITFVILRGPWGTRVA